MDYFPLLIEINQKYIISQKNKNIFFTTFMNQDVC